MLLMYTMSTFALYPDLLSRHKLANQVKSRANDLEVHVKYRVISLNSKNPWDSSQVCSHTCLVFGELCQAPNLYIWYSVIAYIPVF